MLLQRAAPHARNGHILLFLHRLHKSCARARANGKKGFSLHVNNAQSKDWLHTLYYYNVRTRLDGRVLTGRRRTELRARVHGRKRGCGERVRRDAKDASGPGGDETVLFLCALLLIPYYSILILLKVLYLQLKNQCLTERVLKGQVCLDFSETSIHQKCSNVTVMRFNASFRKSGQALEQSTLNLA